MPTLARHDDGLPWWRQLKWRVAALTIACLLGMVAVQNAWLQGQRQRDHDASEQSRNLRLAQYIAERRVQPFLDGSGAPQPTLLRDTAMYIRMISPRLSLYLLDAQGRILDTGDARPLGEPRVDLGPVRHLLGRPDDLPVYGTDPGAPGRRALFSAHPVRSDGRTLGYLYLLLDVQTGDASAADWAARGAARDLWSALALAAATMAVLTLTLHRLLTRRLQHLARELAGFRAEGQAPEAAGRAPPRDELDHIARVAGRLQQRIDQQIRQIQQNESIRRELVSNIAHDLHTPLASIQAYTETLLMGGSASDEVRRTQHLQTIHRQCRRMGRRVQDLFELARLDAGQVAPQMEPFCLAELFSDIMQGLAVHADQRRVMLAMSARANQQALVRADIGLMERVLQNLLDNALRHTPEGGRIEVDIWVDGDKVLTRISDTGSGIAEADLPHIFERYWTQTDGEAAGGERPGTGSGLGLAIVKRILDLHHSIIDVRSRPARGTQFSFSLAAAG